MALLTDVSVVTTGLAFPEGPVAVEDGSVLVVEIAGQRLTQVLPDGTKVTIADLSKGPDGTPVSPNGLAIGPDNTAYICDNGGVFAFVPMPATNGYPDPQGKDLITLPAPNPNRRNGRIIRIDLSTGEKTTLFSSCEGQDLLAPDDIIFDGKGGFWFTDGGYEDTQALHKGGLYYANAMGTSITQAAQVRTANGVGLSPDGTGIYVSDTIFGRLWATEITKQGTTAPGPLPTMPGKVAFTLDKFQWVDSLKVTSDGSVCVCTLIGGGITVFNPTYGSTTFVDLNAMGFGDIMPTNLCFGGPDMRTVWITDSATGRLLKGTWAVPGLKPAYTLQTILPLQP